MLKLKIRARVIGELDFGEFGIRKIVENENEILESIKNNVYEVLNLNMENGENKIITRTVVNYFNKKLVHYSW